MKKYIPLLALFFSCNQKKAEPVKEYVKHSIQGIKVDSLIHVNDSVFKIGDTTFYTTNGHVTSSTYPCGIDTIKGILIWHSGADYNDGNAWDNGYWIGKCGPMGTMPLPEIFFIPGVVKMTRGEILKTGVKYKEVEYPNDGFYDSKFNKIPGEKVYGMVIIREPKNLLKVSLNRDTTLFYDYYPDSATFWQTIKKYSK